TSGFRRAKGTFTIDPTKNPKWIDVKLPAGDSTGIYELKGDRLRVCWASPGEKRPAEFKTKEGIQQAIVTYERIKPPAPKAAEKEKDKATLWPARVLGGGEVPLPDRIVQSDIVVLGRVAALEPKDVEAVLPYKLDYRIAVVKVQEVIHGQKEVKELRLGFISPDHARKVFKAGKAMPMLSPAEFSRVTVGQEGMYFLR